jgi:hypothetical protein
MQLNKSPRGWYESSSAFTARKLKMSSQSSTGRFGCGAARRDATEWSLGPVSPVVATTGDDGAVASVEAPAAGSLLAELLELRRERSCS